jgi:hypothetical protein
MAAELNNRPSALEVKLKAGATQWTPNTASNRKVLAIILRRLADEAGRPLYRCEAVSALRGYPDRRNTHNFRWEFSHAGTDFQAFCAQTAIAFAHIPPAIPCLPPQARFVMRPQPLTRL